MKFLISNDDGIDAPGLAALITAAHTVGEPAVVAPAGPQSGVSHAVTYEGFVRMETRAKNRVAIHGTPADCARIGLLNVVPDAKWVLSGINQGGNLGADVYYSGTVAAVRELVLQRLAQEAPGWRRERLLAVKLGLEGELDPRSHRWRRGPIPGDDPDLV